MTAPRHRDALADCVAANPAANAGIVLVDAQQRAAQSSAVRLALTLVGGGLAREAPTAAARALAIRSAQVAVPALVVGATAGGRAHASRWRLGMPTVAERADSAVVIRGATRKAPGPVSATGGEVLAEASRETGAVARVAAR